MHKALRVMLLALGGWLCSVQRAKKMGSGSRNRETIISSLLHQPAHHNEQQSHQLLHRYRAMTVVSERAFSQIVEDEDGTRRCDIPAHPDVVGAREHILGSDIEHDFSGSATSSTVVIGPRVFFKVENDYQVHDFIIYARIPLGEPRNEEAGLGSDP